MPFGIVVAPILAMLSSAYLAFSMRGQASSRRWLMVGGGALVVLAHAVAVGAAYAFWMNPMLRGEWTMVVFVVFAALCMAAVVISVAGAIGRGMSWAQRGLMAVNLVLAAVTFRVGAIVLVARWT